eukprot:scaffold9724_cov146-Isochrysis_galbana.AAC.1
MTDDGVPSACACLSACARSASRKDMCGGSCKRLTPMLAASVCMSPAIDTYYLWFLRSVKCEE